MTTVNPFSDPDFHPVINLPDTYKVFDFTCGYDPELIRKVKWGIGRYNERRRGMYTAPQYANRRFIHMGIDIWAPPGEPVYAASDGEIVYMADHDQRGNYGPVIILKHKINNKVFFALHGHLSKKSFRLNRVGKMLKRGEGFAKIGRLEENGEWEPHLHYQLSWHDPGEADMPGVVAEDELEKALKMYPDPRIVLGEIY
jgi:peptidoglycan LD-endopeptidase LytH